MSDQRFDLSVVICAYSLERWDDLVAAVESVRRQHVLPREIVVVVDHNPMLLRLARSGLGGVIVLENTEPPGASGARNVGIAATTGSVVAFLDDDAVAEPDWTARLLDGYTGPEILGVGGALLPKWLTRRPAWFPDEFGWVIGCSYRGLPERPAPVRNLIGANMSFRREVLVALGGFRSGFGCSKVAQTRGSWLFRHQAGDEETELCIRATHRWPSGQLVHAPAAVVHHRVPSRRATRRFFLGRCYDEGLGKARLARLVGPRHGLSAERAYTLRVLPAGVARGVVDTLRTGNPRALARSAAILAGFTSTAAGYVMGSLHALGQRHGGLRGQPAPFWAAPAKSPLAEGQTSLSPAQSS